MLYIDRQVPNPSVAFCSLSPPPPKLSRKLLKTEVVATFSTFSQTKCVLLPSFELGLCINCIIISYKVEGKERQRSLDCSKGVLPLNMQMEFRLIVIVKCVCGEGFTVMRD